MSTSPYKPLDPNLPNVRLLILEAGVWDSGIKCELRPASLDESPSYEALSYVWGGPDDLRSIWLCGQCHQVTAKLEIALRHLRQNDDVRILWVDALCINQTDLKEREEQVKRMSSIYKQAATVIAWVGEASDDSNEAIKLIREVGKFTFDNEDILFGSDEDDPRFGASMQTSSDYMETLGFPFASQNWSALWRFLERDFLTRVWIIQELAVRGIQKQSSGVIVCGSESVERVFFDMTCTVVQGIIVVGNCIRADGKQLDEPLRSMIAFGHPQGLIMFQALVTNKFHATDPRDKIYALLGLASESDGAFPTDYIKPIREVLMDLVKFLVEKDGNLKVLIGNRHGQNPLGPSWTPEVSNEIYEDSGMRPDNPFKAAGETRALIEFDDGNGILVARGIYVGELKDVTLPLPMLQKVPLNSVDIRRKSKELGYYTILEHLTRFYTKLGNFDKEVLWRTLIMNRDRTGLDEVYPAPNEFGTMLRVLLGQESLPESFRPELAEEYRRSQFAHPFLNNLQKSLTHHCFFTTTSGRMGIGPYCTRPGDIAVILYGCEFILALRPVGPHFLVIGTAYVQGAMEGQLVHDLAETDTQVFRLC